MPNIDKINDYLQYDDPFVINYINSHSDSDCKAIKNREHIRAVYSTVDMPEEKDKQLCVSIQEELKKNGIWSYTDYAGKSWYNRSHEPIMIIDEKKNMKPITQVSSLVSNGFKIMERQVIYTNQSDNQNAKDIISKVLCG